MIAIRGRITRTISITYGERAIAVWIRNLSWALICGRRLRIPGARAGSSTGPRGETDSGSRS